MIQEARGPLGPLTLECGQDICFLALYLVEYSILVTCPCHCPQLMTCKLKSVGKSEHFFLFGDSYVLQAKSF